MQTFFGKAFYADISKKTQIVYFLASVGVTNCWLDTGGRNVVAQEVSPV